MATVARAGARIELPDVLSLPTNRPVLMAGNHRSLLDLAVTMAIFAKFGISSRIMVREDLVEKGLGGKYLRSIGCIATSKDRRDESEAEAIEAQVLGTSLIAGQTVREADLPQASLIGVLRPSRTSA